MGSYCYSVMGVWNSVELNLFTRDLNMSIKYETQLAMCWQITVHGPTHGHVPLWLNSIMLSACAPCLQHHIRRESRQKIDRCRMIFLEAFSSRRWEKIKAFQVLNLRDFKTKCLAGRPTPDLKYRNCTVEPMLSWRQDTSINHNSGGIFLCWFYRNSISHMDLTL